MQEKDELILRRTLWKLFHIQEQLSAHAEEIKKQNGVLVDLRREHRTHEAELERARQEQAKARSSVMSKEKRIKKAEKALEGKVSILLYLTLLMGLIKYCFHGI